LRPDSPGEAAALLRSLGEEGRAVRPRGGGTKPWGPPIDATDVETRGLNRILEHNVGDFTAVMEAGVPMAEAQSAFAEHGQMLALDPALGPWSGASGGATVGGIMATADSGPMRHRYGGMRDLVVGTTVALSDGTVATSGGKVIKNVAGYDLAKLFTGSFGTLGLILRVAVRLHPLPPRTASAVGASDDPDRLQQAALALAALPLEADCLDLDWRDGAGRLLVRFGSAAAPHQAEETVARMGSLGLEECSVVEDDDELWMRQRVHQRADSPGGSQEASPRCILKVSGRATDLPAVCRAAPAAVGRPALGLYWLSLPADAEAVAAARGALAPRACTLLDAPEELRAGAWAAPEAGALAVMARVKERFDPARIFRPGTFVGGL
jgi:glycolate oxidase FAD binding subunit